MQKIGFFGGSFNPIHHGHLHAAISAKEMCQLDKILICPCFKSPFSKELMSPIERLHMVKLAITGIDGLEICDLEIRRGGVSYTVDTLRELKALYPKAFIRLILSDDLLERFSSWKESERLITDFKPIVVARHSQETTLTGFECIKPPIMDISSTQIRERVKKGLPCQYLMPLACYQHFISLSK